MEQQEVRKILQKNSNFDDITLDYLSEYLSVAQKVFGDSITLEEALERFTKNDRLKNGIRVVDSSEIKTLYKCDASYSSEDKCIRIDKESIKNEDASYIKFLVFHELTHALSIHNSDDKEFIGIQDKSQNPFYKNGFNEAITEYLNLDIALAIKNYSISTGYAVVIEQLQNLMNIVPKEEIMNCYFKDGGNFENILQEYNIQDANYLIRCFDILADKEESIVEIKMGEVPRVEKDSILLVIKEYLYSLYTERFLPVDSIEKFDEKMQIVRDFVNQHDSLNYVDKYGTYIDIMCDREDLIQSGYNQSEIDTILEKYGLDKKEMNLFCEFNFLDETLNTESDSGRTKKCIDLYNLYRKLGREKFCDACDGFFIRLYADFFLDNPDTALDLNNYIKLPFIGKFLRDNPQYDFDELSIEKINYTKKKMGFEIGQDWFYIAKTLDNKTHLIFEDYDDGSCFCCQEIEPNVFIADYSLQNCKLKIEVGEDIKITDLNRSNVKIETHTTYSKRSNYEHLKEKATNNGDEVNQDTGKTYSQIFAECEQRIDKRKKTNSDNVFEL